MGLGLIIGIASIFLIIILLYVKGPKQGIKNIREINKIIESGDYEKAKNILQKMLYSDKFNPDVHYLMAKIYFNLNQYDYTEMELKSIIKNGKFGLLSSKDDVYRMIGESYMKSGDLQEAYNFYSELEKSNPDDYNVAINIGNILLKSKKYEEAIKYFEKALKLRTSDAEALSGLGVSLYSLNNYEKAREYLEQSISFDRRNHTAHYYLALILHKKELFDQAIIEYEKSAPMKSLKVLSLYGMSRCYQQKELWTRAIEHYEELVNYIEEDAEKLRHNYTKRMSVLNNPIVLEARYQLAECYLVDKNFSAAMEQWQEIDSVEPSYKDVKQKIQQNARYGKDRIQDFLILKDMEFEKASRYMVQYLGYIIKKLDKNNKEIITIEAKGSTSESFKDTTLIMIKRGFNPVGERDVDFFYKNMTDKKIKNGIVISPMGISPNAIKYALNKPIEFVGKNQVMHLLKKYENRV